MNQIMNSNIKEAMRKHNEMIAKNEEAVINQKVKSELESWMTWLNRIKSISVGVGFFLCGLGIIELGDSGFVIGIVGGIILYFVLKISILKKMDEIKSNAKKNIEEVYRKADIRTQKEMDAYDNEVKVNSQKILQNSETIENMVNYIVKMFRKRVAQADAGAHIRFIETDFIYDVKKTGIVFNSSCNHINIQDDYNFCKERYRDLKTEAECEGLAKALAKLTIQKMKTIYPRNSLNISVSHKDALVTLHFKAANKNFVVARDIL